jgi:outer membrane protein OmpA-like peptidoglycan-associated protein
MGMTPTRISTMKAAGPDVTGRPRRGARALACATALGLSLTACSTMPDWANPVSWYDSVTSGNSDAPPKSSRATAPADAPAASSDRQASSTDQGASGQGFPSLRAVPEKAPETTTAEERRGIVEGLVADRSGARYTDELLRAGGTPAPKPTRMARAEPTPPPSPPSLPVARVAPTPEPASSQPAMPEKAAVPENAAETGTKVATADAPPPPVPPVSSPPVSSPPVTAAPPVPPPALTAAPPPAPPVRRAEARLPKLDFGATASSAPPPAPPMSAVPAPVASSEAVPVPRPILAPSGDAPPAPYPNLMPGVIAQAPMAPAPVAPSPAASLPAMAAAAPAPVPARAVPMPVPAPRQAPPLAPTPAQAASAAFAMPADSGDQSALVQAFQDALGQSADTVTTLPVGVGFTAPSAPPLSRGDTTAHDVVRDTYNAMLGVPAGQAAAGGAMPSAAAPTDPVVVFFGHGSASITAETRKTLRDLAAAWKARGGILRVVGHASHRTNDMSVVRHRMANFNISLDRAITVSNELIRLGVDPSAVRYEAVSDADPVYYESMPEGEAGNRRAEIFLVS